MTEAGNVWLAPELSATERLCLKALADGDCRTLRRVQFHMGGSWADRLRSTGRAQAALGMLAALGFVEVCAWTADVPCGWRIAASGIETLAALDAG